MGTAPAVRRTRGYRLWFESGPGPLSVANATACSTAPSTARAEPGDTLGENPGADIDPATEQVLRAAGQASEAAALFVRREAPSLSREARLALIDKITALAGQAMDVLHMLAADPDRTVRGKAIGALKRLNRT